MIWSIPLIAVLAALPAGAMAADARRDAILADYAAEARKADPAFMGFSAQRGESLFRSKWTGGDERTPSCTACHTDTPKMPGRNAKTGRPIEPVAVSVNPRRFTDREETDKHFVRDCKSVMGRDCTPLERGDYITFMGGQ
ncbi:MAG: DUF1924 domain-containing protein [Alphaproteobacteria bacterium]